MGLQQNLGDFGRDLRTRIDGMTELIQNIAIRIRQPVVRLPNVDFAGKVCIVTGGNAGIGRATAEAMVARGARVIIACRDKARADTAAKALSATSPIEGCQSHPVEVQPLDLACLKSVKSFASSFNARGLPLALLICNAGIMAPPQRLITQDGLEQQFQVNYLGHWLLIHELLAGQRHIRSSDHQHRHQRNSHAQADRLQSDQQQPDQRHKSGHGLQQGSEQGARVVMLTSLTYKAGRIRFDDLDAKRSYSGFHRYSDSKLAEVLAVRQFAQRMTRTAVSNSGIRDTIVAVHPGLLQTELARKWLHNGCPRLLQPLCIPIVDFLFSRTFLPPEYAVQSVMHAATAPANMVHGKYIARSKEVSTARNARDDITAKKLWDTSCHLTGISLDAM